MLQKEHIKEQMKLKSLIFIGENPRKRMQVFNITERNLRSN